MNFDLRKHTHLLVTGGSRAYGMHKTTSDVDVKGICVPPKEAYFGNLHRFDQVDKPIPLMLAFLDFPDDVTDSDWVVRNNLRFILDGHVKDQSQALKLAQEQVASLSDKGFARFTPEERDAIRAQKLEGTVFNLVKFIGLATEANPNILDVLFCRDEEVRLITPHRAQAPSEPTPVHLRKGSFLVCGLRHGPAQEDPPASGTPPPPSDTQAHAR